MRRFFIPANNINERFAVITGTDVHHISDVLRKRIGDTILATDGMGNHITAKITQIQQSQINLEIMELTPYEERKIYIKLFQAIPKGGKFDWIIEKACELGVNEVVPVITERTIPKYSEERGLKKIARWERISIEAMKQTGRNSPLSIHSTIPFKDIQKNLKAFSFKIILWELEEEKSLKALLQEHHGVKEIELIIGPEGGLSISEVEELKSFGFISASLGKRILKAETAAIATLANIYFELDN